MVTNVSSGTVSMVSDTATLSTASGFLSVHAVVEKAIARTTITNIISKEHFLMFKISFIIIVKPYGTTSTLSLVPGSQIAAKVQLYFDIFFIFHQKYYLCNEFIIY